MILLALTPPQMEVSGCLSSLSTIHLLPHHLTVFYIHTAFLLTLHSHPHCIPTHTAFTHILHSHSHFIPTHTASPPKLHPHPYCIHTHTHTHTHAHTPLQSHKHTLLFHTYCIPNPQCIPIYTAFPPILHFLSHCIPTHRAFPQCVGLLLMQRFDTCSFLFCNILKF
jgi:hypothetical protein